MLYFMKKTLTYAERLLKLAAKRGMLRSSDLVKEEIPSTPFH